jgi:hypothetical protein
MKILLWNVRGLANSPSKLALKRFILLHKPDLLFISEPWLDFADFPRRWFHNLHLKLFATNDRQHLSPNLWCFCNISLNPIILASDSQHVSFSLSIESKTLAFSTIYASINYITRRNLWQSLTSLHSQYSLPWCLIGDFNSILGAHEHRGRVNPSRIPIQDFQSWTDVNNFIHLPTSGSEFTWANIRGGLR